MSLRIAAATVCLVVRVRNACVLFVVLPIVRASNKIVMNEKSQSAKERYTTAKGNAEKKRRTHDK